MHATPPTPAALYAPAPVLAIPAMHLRATVGRDTAEATLARGPGFYQGTGQPGCDCTIAIAGHRVTPVPGFEGHGPFRWLSLLKRGARITLRAGGRTYAYAVSGSRIVSPLDTTPLDDVGHERLVLSTCTPPGSSTYRLIVYALPLR